MLDAPPLPWSWCQSFRGQFFWGWGKKRRFWVFSFLQGRVLSKYTSPVFRKYSDGEKCSLCIFLPKLYFLVRHRTRNWLLWNMGCLAWLTNQSCELGVQVSLLAFTLPLRSWLYPRAKSMECSHCSLLLPGGILSPELGSHGRAS